MYKTTWFGLATIHILSNYISTLTCNDIKANWINFKTNIIYNQWIVSMWNVVMQCNIFSFIRLLQWKLSFYTFCLDPPSEVKSCLLNASDRVGQEICAVCSTSYSSNVWCVVRCHHLTMPLIVSLLTGNQTPASLNPGMHGFDWIGTPLLAAGCCWSRLSVWMSTKQWRHVRQGAEVTQPASTRLIIARMEHSPVCWVWFAVCNEPSRSFHSARRRHSPWWKCVII